VDCLETPSRVSAQQGTITMELTDFEKRPLKGGMDSQFERLTVRVPEASYISGLSRSELYRRAARGEVVFLKCGASTLVDLQSLRATVASLPRASIKSS
jgi:hypothetical protein